MKLNDFKIIGISALTALLVLLVFYFYIPVWNVDKLQDENMLGATVTEISSSDRMSTFPAIYNANLNALNSAKIEISTTTLPNITTLLGLTSVGTLTTGTWNADTLTVAYGGTGSTTLQSNAVLLGNGTGVVKAVSGYGASGQFLTSNGAGSAPTWQTSAVDQSIDYTWTGKHSWTTGTTTFNSQATFATDVTMTTTTASGRFIQALEPYSDSHVANKQYTDYKVRVIDINSSGIGYADNENEQTVLSVTIPANTLSSTTAIRIQAGIYVYDHGTADTAIKLKYGGATISTLEANMSQQFYTQSTPFIAWIYPVGANAQAGNAMWTFSNSGQPNPIYAEGTSAIDSTSAQTLLVTINGDGASSDGGTVWWSVEAMPYNY